MTVMRNRSVLLLMAGQTLSTLADWTVRAALLIWVYTMTHSGAAVSLVGLCEAVPLLLVAPLAGVFVDRWSRAHTMGGAVLARLVLTLPLLAVHGRNEIPLLLAVTLLANGAAQFYQTASGAALPMLVAPEDLGPANSLVQMVGNIVPIVAPALGAGVYGTLGPRALILAVTALYALSVPCLLAVPAGRPGTAGAAAGSVVREMVRGIRYVVRTPLLATLNGAAVIAVLGLGGLSVLDVVFVTHALHRGTALAGLLMASAGLGNLVGASGMWLAGGWVRRRYHVLLWSAGAFNALMAFGYAAAPSLPVAAALLFLEGLAWPPVLISWLTLIQLSTEDAYLGRVMSITRMNYSVSMIISLSCAGMFADALGVRVAIALCAVFMLTAAAFDLVLVRATPATRVVQQPVDDASPEPRIAEAV